LAFTVGEAGGAEVVVIAGIEVGVAIFNEGARGREVSFGGCDVQRGFAQKILDFGIRF
jgi:hypothetical protein